MLVRALPSSATDACSSPARQTKCPRSISRRTDCEVTTLTAEADALERVMQAAIGAGLAGRVHAQIGDLSSWTPDLPLNAVIVNPSALDGLSADERARVIELLQSATMDGGVHLVQTIIVVGQSRAEPCRSRSFAPAIAAGRSRSSEPTADRRPSSRGRAPRRARWLVSQRDTLCRSCVFHNEHKTSRSAGFFS